MFVFLMPWGTPRYTLPDTLSPYRSLRRALRERRGRAPDREVIEAGVDHAPERHEDERAEREARDAKSDWREDEQQRDRDHEEHDTEHSGTERRHPLVRDRHGRQAVRNEIGRESCRERVCQYG